jgi:hypothetical protein
MFKNKTLLFFLLFIFFSIQSSHGSEIKSRSDNFFKFSRTIIYKEIPSSEISDEIEREYGVLFGGYFQNKKYIEKLTYEDLKSLFSVEKEALFYAKDPVILQHMTMTFDRMRKVGGVSADDVMEMNLAYVLVRDFKGLQIFLKKNKFIKKIKLYEVKDEFNAMSAAFLLRVENENKLIKEPFDLASGVKLVIVASPYCHFSNNALSDIESNEEVFEKIRNDTIVVAPQNKFILPLDVFNWNLNSKNFKMKIIQSEKSVPAIDDWSTPVFYFFKDGVLSGKMIGWPKNEGAKNVSRLIEKFDSLKSE